MFVEEARRVVSVVVALAPVVVGFAAPCNSKVATKTSAQKMSMAHSRVD